MKILVADDDPLIRMVVTGGLKALGHEVIACESGLQAWEALKKTRCPVLITDWLMPGLDGLQLTQLVRRAPRDSYTYVIMLTGRSKREDYLAGVHAGVDAFLVKPLDGAMLEAQITIATRILGLEAHTKRLEAIMTVCSYCKKVKDDGEWIDMEVYVARRFKTLPSHAYCPTCFADKVEPELKQLGATIDPATAP
jgi:DNA-binding response OmpR family regulator